MCSCGVQNTPILLYRSKGIPLIVTKQKISLKQGCHVDIVLKNTGLSALRKVFVDVNYYDASGYYIITTRSNIIDCLKPGQIASFATSAIISDTEPISKALVIPGLM
ncbi:FxLYD domain-containing protein [Mucilaginibacter terrenus]